MARPPVLRHCNCLNISTIQRLSKVMPENMSRLEEQVTRLIDELTKLRAQNEHLRGTVADRDQTIQELEGDKQNVKQAVGSPETRLQPDEI